MKRFLILLFVSFVFGCGMAQSCYEQNRADGISEYNKKRFKEAKHCFEAAKYCPDRPQKNDLATWIAKCNKAIKAKEEAKQKSKPNSGKKQPSSAERPKLLVDGSPNDLRYKIAFQAGCAQFSIENASKNYKIKNYPSWMEPENDGQDYFYIYFATNYDEAPRCGSFDVVDAGQKLQVTITQDAYVPQWETEGTSREPTGHAAETPELFKAAKGSPFRTGAITSDGKGFLIFNDSRLVMTENLPTDMQNALMSMVRDGVYINTAALTRSGYYCIIYNGNHWCGHVPDAMSTKLDQYVLAGENISNVTISDEGNFVIITDQRIYASDSIDLESIKFAEESFGTAICVCITPYGCCVVCKNGIYYDNVPKILEDRINKCNEHPTFLVFTDSGTFLMSDEQGWSDYELR